MQVAEVNKTGWEEKPLVSRKRFDWPSDIAISERSVARIPFPRKITSVQSIQIPLKSDGKKRRIKYSLQKNFILIFLLAALPAKHAPAGKDVGPLSWLVILINDARMSWERGLTTSLKSSGRARFVLSWYHSYRNPVPIGQEWDGISRGTRRGVIREGASIHMRRSNRRWGGRNEVHQSCGQPKRQTNSSIWSNPLLRFWQAKIEPITWLYHG